MLLYRYQKIIKYSAWCDSEGREPCAPVARLNRRRKGRMWCLEVHELSWDIEIAVLCWSIISSCLSPFGGIFPAPPHILTGEMRSFTLSRGIYIRGCSGDLTRLWIPKGGTSVIHTCGGMSGATCVTVRCPDSSQGLWIHSYLLAWGRGWSGISEPRKRPNNWIS